VVYGKLILDCFATRWSHDSRGPSVYSIPLSSSGYVRSREKALRLIRRLRIYFRSCCSRNKHCLRTLKETTAGVPPHERVRRCASFLHPLAIVYHCNKNSGLGTICCKRVAWETYTGTSSTVILITGGLNTPRRTSRHCIGRPSRIMTGAPSLVSAIEVVVSIPPSLSRSLRTEHEGPS
jgi:hypothetical protein